MLVVSPYMFLGLFQLSWLKTSHLFSSSKRTMSPICNCSKLSLLKEHWHNLPKYYLLKVFLKLSLILFLYFALRLRIRDKDKNLQCLEHQSQVLFEVGNFYKNIIGSMVMDLYYLLNRNGYVWSFSLVHCHIVLCFILPNSQRLVPKLFLII